MNTPSSDINSSPGTTQTCEAPSEPNSTQPLITANDIDGNNDEKCLLSNQDAVLQNHINNMPVEPTSKSNITKKQESLISIYDNSTDGEQKHKQQINQNTSSLIGILGRNRRSEAFIRRLLLSGLPDPILCDRSSAECDSHEDSNHVSYETFCKQSPSIIIITDSIINSVDDFYLQGKQPLIIDARESIDKYLPNESSHLLLPIPRSYRAFGNLSNWEIENGTQRVAVAVEQASPANLIQFIHDLDCFPCGICTIDLNSNNFKREKSFHHCLFPVVSAIVIFSLCFILSIFQPRNDRHSHATNHIFYQASSITASTSLTLLALLFLIRPTLEIINLMYSFVLKSKNKKYILPQLTRMQHLLQSRRYLAWYSLVFALLHLVFVLLLEKDRSRSVAFYPVFFGLFTLVLLCILSFVYLPWLSERLLWREYHLLTTYLGPFSLLTAFVHVFIGWKRELYHEPMRTLFSLKFLSMFLPAITLLLIFLIHGIVHPMVKLIQSNNKRPRNAKTSAIATKDTSLLP